MGCGTHQIVGLRLVRFVFASWLDLPIELVMRRAMALGWRQSLAAKPVLRPCSTAPDVLLPSPSPSPLEGTTGLWQISVHVAVLASRD